VPPKAAVAMRDFNSATSFSIAAALDLNAASRELIADLSTVTVGFRVARGHLPEARHVLRAE